MEFEICNQQIKLFWTEPNNLEPRADYVSIKYKIISNTEMQLRLAGTILLGTLGQRMFIGF